MSERAEESSVGIALRERYGLVLLLILGAYLLAGFDPSPLITVVSSVLWMTLLLLTLWAPGVPRSVRVVGGGAIAVIVAVVISLALLDGDASDGWTSILLGIAQVAAILAILARIVQHEEVTLQTVMGGVAAYALIAFAMAAFYNGADLLSDTTFLNGVVARGDYTYFSFVTLTTVGYGDITAASDLAKRLVVIEAFVGQVFIIVFVARLVSLWGMPRRLR
ncbi:MAG TPA: potassium channel family protein [Acidimicrobiia bacterium]|nr:potassium channel family protein [Acidimicrobiia bacterium]